MIYILKDYKINQLDPQISKSSPHAKFCLQMKDIIYLSIYSNTDSIYGDRMF